MERLDQRVDKLQFRSRAMTEDLPCPNGLPISNVEHLLLNAKWPGQDDKPVRRMELRFRSACRPQPPFSLEEALR